MSLLNPLRPFDESAAMRPSSSMFEDFFRDLWSPGAVMRARANDVSRFTPRVNVNERGDAYELECELPGVKPEEVKVNLTGDTLTIEGEKSCEGRKDGDTWHLTECSYGSFLRTFTFPAVIDAEQVEATHDHGVLRIRVPKAKASQPRRIEVRPGRRGQAQDQGQQPQASREVPVTGGGNGERRQGWQHQQPAQQQPPQQGWQHQPQPQRSGK